MGIDASRTASKVPWTWPAGTCRCACGACELERRHAEVRDLLTEIAEPPSLARLPRWMGGALRVVPAAMAAAFAGAAGMLSRPFVDDWDPF
ncbi:MAG: hypothetical protein K2X46_15560 [Roseomonas sp.]|nr:hypothetical protein [Roseomonas sp.]MBX9701949.1 hypothetical protein [Acetobacteraceae bacterium]